MLRQPCFSRGRPGPSGEARGEIDLAPFRMPAVFLEFAEVREERVDQLRHTVGVAWIVLGRRREQRHAGRDRRNLGLHFDQVRIIVMVETRRQIDGFEARAECDGQKMQALICRDPRDHGHRLRADEHARGDRALRQLLDGSAAVESNRLDLDVQSPEQKSLQ